jgi:putative flippase GtrA
LLIPSGDAHRRATASSARGATLARWSSFATVGAVGFVVDATLLSLLVHIAAWPHYGARAVSFAAAVTFTWYGNRQWVFARTNNATFEYGAYFGVQSVGAIINLGTYASLIAVLPAVAQIPVIPLSVGAALALLFNYAGASRWVFAVPRAGNRQAE